MGREIRRVPFDWSHPRDEQGHFIPMYEHFPFNAAEVAEGLRDGWLKGEPPNYGCDVMPQWPEDERTHLQVYETVTEGTPVSPMFDHRDELVRWLVQQGYNAQAARAFAAEGWAPSFVLSGGRMYRDIEAGEVF